VKLIIIIFIIMTFLHPIITTSTLDADISSSSILSSALQLCYFLLHVSSEQLNLTFERSHFVVRSSTADKCLRFILG